jgi:hypothetical protein
MRLAHKLSMELRAAEGRINQLEADALPKPHIGEQRPVIVTGRVNCCAAPGFQAARSNASMLFSETRSLARLIAPARRLSQPQLAPIAWQAWAGAGWERQAIAILWAIIRVNADEAGRQRREELQQLRSGDALADHHDAINIYAVNLKNRLRDIETDRANLAHGRLPSKWFVSTQPPYGTLMPQSGRRPQHH